MGSAKSVFYAPSATSPNLTGVLQGSGVVEPRLFHMLAKAKALVRRTGGDSYPTVEPMMRCWGVICGCIRQYAHSGGESRRQQKVVGMQERAFSNPGHIQWS